MSLNKSVVCPVLIGRADDLAALQRLASATAQGEGQVVLIAGEAGIGKSRLVTESFKIAKQSGAQVLRGNCFETDRTLPYAPLLDLLRNFNSSHKSNDLSIYYGSTAQELGKILPDLAIESNSAASPALEPEQEKRRIFQTLTQFLLERSEKKAFIVIEDLHWCDDTSLEFLLYFARRLRGQPVLLLLTYRNDEIGTALEHFLAELDRERIATELTLRRLSAGEVDAMLRAIFDLDRPVRPEFLNVLYPLTEGNPFFLEETLKSLIVAGELFYADGTWDRKPIEELHVPRSVQDAVRRRMQQITEEARRVLGIGAAVGQRFDFALVQVLTRLDEEALLKAVKELIASQLITEEAHDRFAFRHALTREAIYSQLIEHERRSLHQKIGEAIEQLGEKNIDEQAANLAYHFHQANVWDKAMQYSARAAQKAQALYAPRAAIEHLTHAIEARRQLGLPASSEYHRARGSAYGILGDFERARLDYEAALQAAHASADNAEEWQSLLDLGLLWAGRDYAETGRYYQRAYDLAEALNDPQMRAHALNRLGNWRVNIEQPTQGLEHHIRALELFQQQDDRRGLAETLDLLGMANYIRGDLVQSEEHYERAEALFRTMNDRQALASSLASKMLNSSHLQSGMAVLARSNRDGALQRGEEALRIAREIGWRSGEVYALIMLGDYFGVRGDYAQAFEHAKGSLALAREIEHSQWITYARYLLGALYLDVLALPEARKQLDEALVLANQIGSRWWITNVTGYLALTHLLQNDLAGAARVLEAALETRVDPILSERSEIRALTMGQRLCWYAAGELALARGEPDAALHVAEQLLAASANVSGTDSIPRLSLLQAKALLAMGRLEEAEAALEAARQEARREGERPLLWRVDAALGRLYQMQGRGDASSEALLTARKLIAELAEGIPEANVRENFTAAAAGFLPRTRALSPREAAKRESGGLTAREREVAVMIAQGKSNREIAEAMVVGERTVETHVSNILTKLGFASRAQVAAWAVEKGLSRDKEG